MPRDSRDYTLAPDETGGRRKKAMISSVNMSAMLSVYEDSPL
jgi:hypothetical protein